MQTLAPRVRPIGGPAKNPDQYGTVVGCEAVAGEENAVKSGGAESADKRIDWTIVGMRASHFELDDEKRAIVIDCLQKDGFRLAPAAAAAFLSDIDRQGLVRATSAPVQASFGRTGSPNLRSRLSPLRDPAPGTPVPARRHIHL